MIKWIKRKLGIALLEEENKRLKIKIASFEEENKRLKIKIASFEEENKRLGVNVRTLDDFVRRKAAELKEYTRVDADIGIRGNNTIVLTGVYRGKAYVRFYDMGNGEFERLIQQLKDMNSHALIRHVDAPPSFRGIFEI